MGPAYSLFRFRCAGAPIRKRIRSAGELFLLLDSGTEESLLALTDDVFCIARPRRGPLLLERGAMPHVTFYFELALWGEN